MLSYLNLKEEFEKQGINRFRPLIETEAETIAYVVADYLGVDTSCYSIGYITSWSAGNEDLLEASVKQVSKISNLMIDKIEEQLGEVNK